MNSHTSITKRMSNPARPFRRKRSNSHWFYPSINLPRLEMGSSCQEGPLAVRAWLRRKICHHLLILLSPRQKKRTNRPRSEGNLSGLDACIGEGWRLCAEEAANTDRGVETVIHLGAVAP